LVGPLRLNSSTVVVCILGCSATELVSGGECQIVESSVSAGVVIGSLSSPLDITTLGRTIGSESESSNPASQQNTSKVAYPEPVKKLPHCCLRPKQLFSCCHLSPKIGYTSAHPFVRHICRVLACVCAQCCGLRSHTRRPWGT
jgi:hypothetical protein